MKLVPYLYYTITPLYTYKCINTWRKVYQLIIIYNLYANYNFDFLVQFLIEHYAIHTDTYKIKKY